MHCVRNTLNRVASICVEFLARAVGSEEAACGWRVGVDRHGGLQKKR